MGSHVQQENHDIIMNMDIPYLRTGRTSQKARTRDALISAARRLLARGVMPTIEEVASVGQQGAHLWALNVMPSSEKLYTPLNPPGMSNWK
jgi:histidine ammonia-lyase